VILPLPCRRISPPRDETEDPISPTLQWLVEQAPKPLTPPTAADFADYKHFLPNLAEKRPKTVSYYDVKDPTHPYYKHSQMQQAKHQYDGTVCPEPEDGLSKDTADLEAVEDPKLIPSTAHDIPSHTTSEALPLDATAREDTMREDAPLATSHDTSMFPSRSDDVMLDEEL
jgi:hypothetical protein